MSELVTGVHSDEALADFLVRSERGARELHMTRATFRALVGQDALGPVAEAVEARPESTYRIPSTFGYREIADEVALALSVVDPEPSVTCILPTCGQPTVSMRRDFPLCADHAAAFQGWDDVLI